MCDVGKKMQPTCGMPNCGCTFAGNVLPTNIKINNNNNNKSDM